MRIAVLLIPLLLLPCAGSTGKSFHVLCYHAFIPGKNRYCFTTDELEAHIKFLRREGFRFVSLSDIRYGRFSGNRNVLVSIDDGNRSAWDAYYRVLKMYSIRPLVAVYPSVIGHRKYALTWEQLSAMSGDGCDIAAHGYCHLNLNDALYRNNRSSFKREIFYSRKILEQRLHRKIDVFVYPYGGTCGHALRLVREAGYRCAFTVRKGGMECCADGVQNCFEIPRYCMTRYNADRNLGLIAGNCISCRGSSEKRYAGHAGGRSAADPASISRETRLFSASVAMASGPVKGRADERKNVRPRIRGCTGGLKKGYLSTAHSCVSSYSVLLEIAGKRVRDARRETGKNFSACLKQGM